MCDDDSATLATPRNPEALLMTWVVLAPCMYLEMNLLSLVACMSLVTEARE